MSEKQDPINPEVRIIPKYLLNQKVFYMKNDRFNDGLIVSYKAEIKNGTMKNTYWVNGDPVPENECFETLDDLIQFLKDQFDLPF